MKVGDLVRIKPHLTENRGWLIGVVNYLYVDGVGHDVISVCWINDGMREDIKYQDDLEIINE